MYVALVCLNKWQAVSTFLHFIFLALLVFTTAELLSWPRRPSSVVRRPSVNSGFSETACCMDPDQILSEATYPPFLQTMLDYVSRAHEIEIRPSSVVRPSVRRPSVASIISEVIAWISFKFQLWLPLGHMPRLFLHFWNLFFLFYKNIFHFR